MTHNIKESWQWLARKHQDGTIELVGVVYPNGDEVLREAMPVQQWEAYLRRGRLKMGKARTPSS